MSKRLAILTYGSSIYALFLGVFTYATLFVGGLLVPRTVDAGGPASPLAEAILIDLGLLSLFAIQHTIMARAAFKRAWTRLIHPAIERSTFVLATCLCLGLLFWQWRPLDLVVWEVSATWARGLLWGTFALGMGTVLYSTFLIDHFGLFGLRQVVDHFRGREAQAHALQIRSLYRWVRHPLMLGFLVAFWSAPTMTASHLLFTAVVTGYVFFGTWIEERGLVAEHGEAYRRYQREVPAILPLPRLGRTPRPAAEPVAVAA